jgi:hypothetical protein
VNSKCEEEVWNRKDIIAFATMMGWHDLINGIEALNITPKQTFADNLKHGEIQITLYRKVDEQDGDDCPFYFTEDCK